MKKTSFLALLGKIFPEKLSGLSVKGGEGGRGDRNGTRNFDPEVTFWHPSPFYFLLSFIDKGGGDL